MLGNQKIGETVYDPAAGTCGFLVEAYEYMRQQRTIEDRETLQTRTLYGTEKKPMPYLLGMMNLLLHGIEYPNLVRANTLARPLFEKLYGADELVLRPTAEWVLSAEVGTQFEFKWSMASHRNTKLVGEATVS